MLTFTRRRSLGTALALLFSTAVPVAHADPANVPVIWDGKKMFESFQNEATAFRQRDQRVVLKRMSLLTLNVVTAGICTASLNPFWIRLSLYFVRFRL